MPQTDITAANVRPRKHPRATISLSGDAGGTLADPADDFTDRSSSGDEITYDGGTQNSAGHHSASFGKERGTISSHDDSTVSSSPTRTAASPFLRSQEQWKFSSELLPSSRSDGFSEAIDGSTRSLTESQFVLQGDANDFLKKEEKHRRGEGRLQEAHNGEDIRESKSSRKRSSDTILLSEAESGVTSGVAPFFGTVFQPNTESKAKGESQIGICHAHRLEDGHVKSREESRDDLSQQLREKIANSTHQQANQRDKGGPALCRESYSDHLVAPIVRTGRSGRGQPASRRPTRKRAPHSSEPTALHDFNTMTMADLVRLNKKPRASCLPPSALPAISNLAYLVDNSGAGIELSSRDNGQLSGGEDEGGLSLADLFDDRPSAPLVQPNRVSGNDTAVITTGRGGDSFEEMFGDGIGGGLFDDLPVVAKLEPFKGAYRRGKRLEWTGSMTELFYEALAMYGSDLMLVGTVFPNLSAKDIHRKFAAEQRANPRAVASVLTGVRKTQLTTARFEATRGIIDTQNLARRRAIAASTMEELMGMVPEFMKVGELFEEPSSAGAAEAKSGIDTAKLKMPPSFDSSDNRDSQLGSAASTASRSTEPPSSFKTEDDDTALFGSDTGHTVFFNTNNSEQAAFDANLLFAGGG